MKYGKIFKKFRESRGLSLKMLQNQVFQVPISQDLNMMKLI